MMLVLCAIDSSFMNKTFTFFRKISLTDKSNISFNFGGLEVFKVEFRSFLHGASTEMIDFDVEASVQEL